MPCAPACSAACAQAIAKRGSASTGDDRHLAATGIYGGLDDQRMFVAGQRKELTRTTGANSAVAPYGEPFEAAAIAIGVKCQPHRSR
jgi:hypothetical protein